MNFHVAQIKNKDIVPCSEVPNDVREKVLRIVTFPKKQKTAKKLKIDNVANAQQNSSSVSGGEEENATSSGQLESPDPSQLSPRICHGVLPADGDAWKQKKGKADKKIAAFFFHNAISFNAAKSLYYQEMVDAVIDCGAGYKPPSYEKLSTSLLQGVKGDMDDQFRKLRMNGEKQAACCCVSLCPIKENNCFWCSQLQVLKGHCSSSQLMCQPGLKMLIFYLNCLSQSFWK